jgi:capsid protein
MPNKLAISKAMERNASRETVALEYEATQSNSNRKQAKTGKKSHQDITFTQSQRQRAENATQNVLENVPLAGWMIRRHLDAVANFYVDVDSSVPKELRDQIEALFKWAGKPDQFDAARRHNIQEAWRLYELNKVIDGDSLMVKIDRRKSPRYGSVQLVEGSRIMTPRDLPDYLAGVDKDGFKKVNDHGIEVDPYGGAKSFIICKYAPRGHQMMFDRRVLARDAIYSGYFNRYSQTRGESPLLCAVNQLLDIKEGMEYILLKIKLHALFGYAITKEAISDIGDGLGSTAETVIDEDAEYEDDAEVDTSREVDISRWSVVAVQLP